MPRLYLLLLALICCSPVLSQNKKKPVFNNKMRNEQGKFLDKQWWLGFKTGVNLSKAVPDTRYTVLTPTNYPNSVTDKSYDAFNKAGSQATLEVTFNFKGIAISAQPTYSHSRFTYSNQLEWRNTENAAERLTLKYDQEQSIDFADFPLIAKYEFLSSKLRPYIQGGVFYSFLVNATKSVEVSGTDYASGGTNSFKNEPVIVGAKDLFDNYWGLIAGTGVNYHLGNVRLVFDVSYRKGMSNMANVKNRFSNDRLSGIGDAQDDVMMNNILISVGCLFPLRFLSNDYTSVD